jgi:hypothetical protein
MRGGERRPHRIKRSGASQPVFSYSPFGIHRMPGCMAMGDLDLRTAHVLTGSDGTICVTCGGHQTAGISSGTAARASALILIIARGRCTGSGGSEGGAVVILDNRLSCEGVCTTRRSAAHHRPKRRHGSTQLCPLFRCVRRDGPPRQVTVLLMIHVFTPSHAIAACKDRPHGSHNPVTAFKRPVTS